MRIHLFQPIEVRMHLFRLNSFGPHTYHINSTVTNKLIKVNSYMCVFLFNFEDGDKNKRLRNGAPR
jgi:hypothetical protein